MGIKTSELQQLTSVRETDSILVDANGMGTGRLPFADAAEFFREELTKPGTEAGNVLTAALEAAAAAQSQAAQAAQMAQETAAAAITPEQVDEAPIEGSENPISSGGTFAALAAKQNRLTGLPGQVAGFNEAGELEAQDLPSGTGSVSNQNISDNAYWAAKSMIVNQRGQDEYTGGNHTYTIDRWHLGSSNTKLQVNDGFIRLSATSAGGYPSIVQIFEHPEQYIGEMITLSVLYRNAPGTAFDVALKTQTDGSGFTHNRVDVVSEDWSLLTCTGVVPDDTTSLYANLIIITPETAGLYVDLLASKTEIGDHQTLAHQDKDGNWVLNDPPPNMALELAKCQSYQALGELAGTKIWTNTSTKTAGVFFPLPVSMRAKPTLIGTIDYEKDGVNSKTPIAANEIKNIVLYKNGVYVYISSSSIDFTDVHSFYIEAGSGFDANL